MNRRRVTVARADGTRQVVVGGGDHRGTLVWSPDGTRLLRENEGARLVVAVADGSGRPRPLTRGFPRRLAVTTPGPLPRLTSMSRSVVVAALRTPFGKLGGALKTSEATQLART